ncbi:MAG: tetratricopeptide repeat protein [Deltaproteobacteria bacterium]|nr:tetratricopeptide repeat protein [Deltaproteobacteria bacterium]
MKRQDRLASVLVVAILLVSSGVAKAQDMVFTTSDVGEVAAPPPTASGPPSEALANALRLYQQEHYAQAAVQFQRIIQGETGDQPANVQKAQFFLGKCFYHLGFYQAALGVFEEIAMMSTGHLYFQTSLQWLAQLSRELPEPAGIIGLVGRYGDSISVLQEFNKKETKDLYNELLYLMGRYWYQQGEFAKARDFFLEIDRTHELYVNAVFFVGITHVRERHAEPASKAFLSIVNKFKDTLFLSDEEERFLNLAWLSLARIYYSTKHWDSAVQSWNQLPQSSEYYLDALFEESWAFFQIDKLDRALGNIHTINSPYFEEYFYPESVVLKAVIYFGQCLYDDAQKTVADFTKKYTPIQQQLQAALGKFPNNQAFFDFLRKLRELDKAGAGPEVDVKASPGGGGTAAEQKTIMGFSPEILSVIKGALGDRTLLRNLEYVDILEKEEQKLSKMPPMFVNSGAGIRIQQDINTAKSVAIDNTGNLARSRYERLLGEIQDLLNQATRVEIEILKALRGELDLEIQQEQAVQGPTVQQANIESDAEHVLWPFQGEYWRDELGYYRQPISSHCGR